MKLVAMGEAIIDMKGEGEVKNATSFIPQVGGAPLNVLAAFCLLGGEASFISKVGLDGFGDKIIELSKEIGIDTSYVLRTKEANTALAFVTLGKDGSRDFSFYRKPSSDMLLIEDEISETVFDKANFFHFGSVDLVSESLRKAHQKAISLAKKAGCLICFDPNLRFSLWDDLDELYQTIQSFIKYADILKVSIDELEFITRIKDFDLSIKSLLDTNIKILILTKGGEGSMVIYQGKVYETGPNGNKAIDTTGAGDAFMGSFLYFLSQNNLSNEGDLAIQEALENANYYAGYSVESYGAIPSYLSKEEYFKRRGVK